MQRRTFLATATGALATAGCMPEGKLLQVTAPPTTPPRAKIERVLIWLSPNITLASEKLGDAFVAAFAPYGVPVKVGRASALELNRGDDQAKPMTEIQATHRLEIEVGSFRSGGGIPAEWTLVVSLYAGTARRPIMALQYKPAGFSDYSVATVVVQKLREYGYL